MVSRTLGIDLASQSANTAACQVRWSDGAAVVDLARVDVDDGDLLELARRADVVGIDCPFGWPEPFVRALALHHDLGSWPGPWNPEALRTNLCRRTDHFVIKTAPVRPLSVSADRIAMPAMRCAWMLSELGVRDRSADGRVFEV